MPSTNGILNVAKQRICLIQDLVCFCAIRVVTMTGPNLINLVLDSVGISHDVLSRWHGLIVISEPFWAYV